MTQREGTILIIDGIRYQEADARQLGLMQPAAAPAAPSPVEPKPEPKARAKSRPAGGNKARKPEGDATK